MSAPHGMGPPSRETPEIEQQAWAIIERLYSRLGTKSARGLDLDAAVCLTKLVEELERLRAEQTGE